jgi:ABC-type nitrate/sulfonate/bicarbonate transport system substrate-binding protein
MVRVKNAKRRSLLIGIALLLVLLLGLAAGAGCTKTGSTAPDQITVLLDWNPNTNFSGLYAAKDKGYYLEEGLDVKIEEAGANVLPLVAANKAQFGISYQEQVTFARLNDSIPVVSIAAIVQHNSSGFASFKEKGIKTAADFEGKSYGSWGTEVEEVTIKALMDKAGADFSKVSIVTIGETDLFAVIEKLADFAWIYYGWDGIAAELKGAELNFIPLRELDPAFDYYTPVIISSESLINEHPDLVKRFMRATARGYRLAIDNPAAAAEILLQNVPELDRDLVMASQDWLKDKYQAESELWGLQKKEVWENYSRWLFDHGLVDEMLDVDSAFTNKFVLEDEE